MQNSAALTQKVFEERGYVVVCGYRQYEVGEICHLTHDFDATEIPEPITTVVQAVTDQRDMEAQLRSVGLPEAEWNFNSPGLLPVYFHRVVAE